MIVTCILYMPDCIYRLTQERCQAAALGWCIEFLQAFFLVADDLMDDSVTRRGQPCWFRLPEVKTIAVNDRYALIVLYIL